MKLKELNNYLFKRYYREGYSELQSVILANRTNEFNKNFLNPRLRDIQKPDQLETKNCDLEKAVNKLHETINKGNRIALFTDYDVDGCTSMALLYKVIKNELNYDNVAIVYSDRNEGYGITDKAIKRINNENPHLVITADLGIGENKGISKINSDVIVTDHHLPPEEKSNAYAVLDPHLSEYESEICGCAVSWLYMISCLKKNKERMIDYLDYVALATIADMMPMNKITNRFFVKAGINIFNKRLRPCWNFTPNNIDEGYFGFGLGPKINSCSRMKGLNKEAVKFLTEESMDGCEMYNDLLTSYNDARKTLQSNLYDRVLKNVDSNIIIYYDKNKHTGILGLTAGRLSDKFNAVSLIMCDTDEKNIVAGSARSNNLLNLKECFDEFEKENPKILNKYGGHSGAAGFNLNKKNVDKFEKLIKPFIADRIKGCIKEETYDYELSYPSMDYLRQIEELSPYGRLFERPLFYGELTLKEFKVIGKTKEHCSMRLNDVKAVDFFSLERHDYYKKRINKTIKCIYDLQRNEYKGKTYLQIMIKKVLK